MSRTEMIVIIQASLAGKKIECRARDADATFLIRQTECLNHGAHADWSPTCNKIPIFSFGLFDYRVKPE